MPITHDPLHDAYALAEAGIFIKEQNRVDMNRRNPPPGFNPAFITAPLLQDKPWDIRSLVIDVSGSCNMACRYCVEAITMPKRLPMSPETFDAAWRFLFPNGIKAVTEETDLRKKAFSIHMGCGEPLLNFPLLEKIRERVDQARLEGVEDFFVFLTTNALLMDEKIMDWLIASNWNIKISIDGPAAPLCTGPCFACAEMFGPGHGHPIDINCAYMLADAEAASFLYHQLKQRNPEKLLAFLPNLSDEFFD